MSKPVDLLIPQRFVAGHELKTSDYISNPQVRSMGSGLDLLARRKDGSEFPVDVMLSPVNAPTGLLVLAVVRDISERLSAVEAQVSLIAQLQSALAEVRTLRGLLPICSYCKQIRVDTGSWQQIEVYLKAHTEAEFSHGICPACAEQQLAEFRNRKATD